MKMAKHFLAVLVASGVFTSCFADTWHKNKTVQTIFSPDTRECTFFRLVDVSQADAALANNPWFAIPLDHNGHNVIVSMVLTAYTTGTPIDVRTNGNVSCGHAEVKHLFFSY